jgi:hypothetical protein
MATLRARNIEATFLFGQLAGTDGNATYVQFTKDGTVLLRNQLVVMDFDVSELGARLLDVAEQRTTQTRVEITDGDFILEAERLESPGDVSVRFWHGEPYMLMCGYRFVVKSADLREFASELIAEATRRRLS